MGNRFKQVVSIACIATLSVVSLSGCVSKDGKLVGQTDMTLADAKEVREFYAEELKGINLLETHTRKIEDSVAFMEMDKADEEELLGAINQLVPKINATHYSEDNYFKKQMHGNIKAVLQDKVLLGGKMVKSQRTRDMYIIDMEYDVVFRGSWGGAADSAKYLGLNGAFKIGFDNQYYMDTSFLNTMYAQYKAASDAERVAIEQGLAGYNTESKYNEETSYIDLVTENFARYNNVLGATLSTPAIMPPLDFIFAEPPAEGDISGVGIRFTCERGLNEFGFDRNSLKGKAIIRYIFKEDSATDKKNLDNVYVWEYNITEGVPTFSETDVFPEFAETAIKVAVERADRVLCNSDISGMSNGKIFGNKLFAIDYGNKTLSTKQIKYGSTVAEELKRKGRLWLVKVDTKQTEEVKYINKGPAAFAEIRYLVLEQYGDTFIIVDEVTTSRKTIDEPALDYGDTNTRRFNSLYNAGNISDESKVNIRKFMSDFYGYCQNKEWQSLADSICSDTKLLSRAKKSELYYGIREYLIKSGDASLTYMGAITDWLGGSSDPQVEFKTLELEKLPDGQCYEFTKYYLVSVFGDKWVINDIKELTKVELNSQSDITKVESDIKGYLNSEVNSGTEE